jgi:hypothetical protein
MPNRPTPLDAPLKETPRGRQDLFKSLLLQIPLIFFFVMGHLLYFNPIIVGLGGFGVLMLAELLTSKSYSDYIGLRIMTGVLGVLLLGYFIVFYNNPFSRYVIYGELFCWAALFLYQFLWYAPRNSNVSTTRRPLGRLLLATAFAGSTALLSWLTLSKYGYTRHIFLKTHYLLPPLIFTGAVIAAFVLHPRFLPTQTRLKFADDLTWLRFPQLLYLLVVLLFYYFQWNDFALNIY